MWRAFAVFVALVLAGCGAGAETGRSTLTLGAPSAPASLDPATANVDPSGTWFPRLAYDSLLALGPDGRIEGQLASRWGYVGAGNRVFELTLRGGDVFADGTPVDAAAVVASLDHWRKGRNGTLWAPEIARVEAVGALKVRIVCRAPNPELPRLLTWQFLGGTVINPKALENPSQLGTRTFGSGPYMLDPSATVTGSRYTYVPNPRYRGPRPAEKVVVRVYVEQNAALSALRSGQVDLFVGASPATADAGKAAGLGLETVPLAFAGVNLLDRGGQVAPALADVRVRQALNLAVDRSALVSGLFRAYAEPTSQLGTPASGAWFDTALDRHWPYDPERARRLLAAAGYPDGFALDLTTPVFGGTSLLTQAVAGYWARIGVEARVGPEVGPAAWGQAVNSRRYPASGFLYGAVPMFLQARNWFEPTANAFNVWASRDERLLALLARAADTTGAAQDALYAQVQRRALELAWAVPVARLDNLYLFRRELEGVQVRPGEYFVDPRKLSM